MTFVDRITLTLELAIGESTYSVPAGNLKNFNLELSSYGFKCRADWWFVALQNQSEDELFASFVTQDLITATLTIDRTFDEVGVTTESLIVKGLVGKKQVSERAFGDVQGEPILQRRYEIEFEDRASLLWRQHFPNALYVDQSLKDLIEDNKPAGLTIDYDWTRVETTYPIHSLGLGDEGNHASFYDFIFWILDAENAGLFFDAAEEKYSIKGAKSSEGTAIAVLREDIDFSEARFPALFRHSVSVLNGYAEATTKKTDVANEKGVTGTRRDVLLNTPIDSVPTALSELETKRIQQPEPELFLRFARYPSVTMKPGNLYELGDGWSDKIFQNGKTYRLYRLDIRANAVSQVAADDLESDTNNYQFEIEAALELSTDLTFKAPSFIRPRWPYYVEGKVISEVGETTQGTYQMYPDDTTSLEYYHVKVPLWDKQIIVPYNPALISGHFYFPAYRDERVLLALEFRSAWIKRFLDWRPGAKLPKETQGDHILFGKKAKDETSVRHVYEDAKPVLSITRTNDTDTQTIKISEGVIFLETKEESGS